MLMGLDRCEIVLVHLWATRTFVCLNKLVNVLICGDVYVKVVHFVFLVGVGGVCECGGFGPGVVPLYSVSKSG